MHNQVSVTASGNVEPSRFIKISGDGQGETSGAGDTAILGVSDQQSYRESSGTLATITGEPIPLQPGRVVKVEPGAAVAPGTNPYLKSDANGRAIPTTAGDVAVAMAVTGAGAAATAASPLTIQAILIPGGYVTPSS